MKEQIWQDAYDKLKQEHKDMRECLKKIAKEIQVSYHRDSIEGICEIVGVNISNPKNVYQAILDYDKSQQALKTTTTYH